MKNTYYKLSINETGYPSPVKQNESQIFNNIEEYFATFEDIKKYLVDRYGKVPPLKNKIYVDTDDSQEQVGFLYSYWNSDISHNSKSWWQIDWICIYTITQQPINLNNLFKRLNIKSEHSFSGSDTVIDDPYAYLSWMSKD